MLYDPQWPQNGQNIDADRFRDQFSGVIDLINAAPGITSAVVDSVTTLPPGSQAQVSVSVAGTVLHLSFGLPQGGPGNPGSDGPQGPQGPPFANAVVDSVTTLNPGEPATVGVIFDGTNVRLSFGIPRGSDGAMGLPGEVSQVDLNNAQLNTLSQTSNNSNAVATLDTPFADPDAEALRQAYNSLVAALRR